MPKINLRGETFQVCPDADSHFTDLASNLELLQSSGNYTDINIHCKDKIVLSVHRQSISKFSKILKQIFTSHCDCLTFTPIVFDLLLPGKIAYFFKFIPVSPGVNFINLFAPYTFEKLIIGPKVWRKVQKIGVGRNKFLKSTPGLRETLGILLEHFSYINFSVFCSLKQF